MAVNLHSGDPLMGQVKWHRYQQSMDTHKKVSTHQNVKLTLEKPPPLQPTTDWYMTDERAVQLQHEPQAKDSVTSFQLLLQQMG